jgi:hypothetical protein
VIDLNRAIAHSIAFGPEAGLRLVDEIAGAAALRDYAPLPAARGDFLFRPVDWSRRVQNSRLRPRLPATPGKGNSPRTGGRLRLQALNPVSELPLRKSASARRPAGLRSFSPHAIHDRRADVP